MNGEARTRSRKRTRVYFRNFMDGYPQVRWKLAGREGLGPDGKR